MFWTFKSNKFNDAFLSLQRWRRKVIEQQNFEISKSGVWEVNWKRGWASVCLNQQKILKNCSHFLFLNFLKIAKKSIFNSICVPLTLYNIENLINNDEFATSTSWVSREFYTPKSHKLNFWKT